jgi:GxxExxY protein
MNVNYAAIPEAVEEIGRRVIGCAIALHQALGPGYREIVYRRALCLELHEQDLPLEIEKRILVPYKKWKIDGHRLDIVIEGCVIVELKVVPRVKGVHRMQVRSYLKATGLRLGYVMNFDEEVLKNGIRRVVV